MASVPRSGSSFTVTLMEIDRVGRCTSLCQMFDLEFIAGYGGQD